MKIGFVINELETEVAEYTTTRLELAAHNMGHEVWVLGVGDFAYGESGAIFAHARGPAKSRKNFKTVKSFMSHLKGDSSRNEKIAVNELDVLMLRNDPAADAGERPWAQSAGILFGQLVARHGVIVLNDPVNLANAIAKTYFQHFPEEVRPATCISRDRTDIKQFIEAHGGKAVLKPLQGSGGQGVFMTKPNDKGNLNQMIDAVTRDGYAIVQEYLPAAKEGDMRLFVMNGRPLERNGKIAAFRRVNQGGDIRSNMSAGGKVKSAVVDDDALMLVEMVRPKLVADGMFLVGLDVVKNKLMEINVFSPGGLGSAQKLTGEDFAATVIESIENKVRYRRFYGSTVDNPAIATM